MARKRKKPEPVSTMGVPAWMMTFADTMSLLLTFFVLLLTFSTTSNEDFKKASGGLVGTLGSLDRSAGDSAPSIVETRIARAGRVCARGPETPPELGPLAKRAVQIRTRFRGELAGLAVTVPFAHNGFVVRVSADELFGGARASLAPGGRRKLAKIAAVLRYLPNDIEIAAHTDGMQPGGTGGMADVRLATGQATAVAQFLEEYQPASDPGARIAPGRLAIRACGGWQPIDPRNSRAARRQNRRVDITLLKYAR